MPVSDIRFAVLDIRARADAIQIARDYYNGEHRLAFATSKWRSAFKDMFDTFRDNLCPAVVNAKADRLQLTGVSGPTGSDVAVASIWAREQLQRRVGEIMKSSLKEGDAFVVVWPDAMGAARWYVQRADRMAVQWDAVGNIVLAVKFWPLTEYLVGSEKTKWRATIYYADHVERYVTLKDIASNETFPEQTNAWEPFNDKVTEEGDAVGAMVLHDYGRVPVFAFCNDAETSSYGVSDLRDVIPVQDALNKTLADMLVAGEFAALPQRWIAGIEVETDEAGVAKDPPWRAGIDRIMAVANTNAKFGEFSAANLQSFISASDSWRAEMARVSRTPLHYLLLSGDFPSGVALGAAERPLEAVIDDRQIAFGQSFEAAMAFSLTLEGKDTSPDECNSIWKDTAWHDPAAQADELRLKKELGIPDEQLWEEMGYDADQIQKFADAKLERTLEMQANFDAGGPGVNPGATAGTPAGMMAGLA